MHLLPLSQAALAVGQISFSNLTKFLFSVEESAFLLSILCLGSCSETWRCAGVPGANQSSVVFFQVKLTSMLICSVRLSSCLEDLLILATIEKWHLSNNKLLLNVFWCIAGINVIQLSTWPDMFFCFTGWRQYTKNRATAMEMFTV